MNHVENILMEGKWEKRADERCRAITAIHSMMCMRIDHNRESRSGPSQPLMRSTFPPAGRDRLSGCNRNAVIYIVALGVPLYEDVYTRVPIQNKNMSLS